MGGPGLAERKSPGEVCEDAERMPGLGQANNEKQHLHQGESPGGGAAIIDNDTQYQGTAPKAYSVNI